ncbi:MAG: lyase family protein, partial [Anaerolineales bacterium]
AEAQHAAGLVSAEQVADLRAHVEDVDLARAREIEAEIRHDLMAELLTYAGQCPLGGGVLHLGATSMDILDNVEALRLQRGLDLVLKNLRRVNARLADQIDAYADVPTLGFTHLQPAELTTVGYRLAQHGQDLAQDEAELARVRAGIRGKGFKGAVGTGAAFGVLLHGTGWTAAEMESDALRRLGLQAFPVATQTYPRKQDWLVLNALAGLGATLYKFAFDVRLLQSPLVGEWAEPFGARQVGSSAMPFKRNPINAEKIDSLARYLAALPRVAWDNAAHNLLERTLDDSANRRLLLPEAFLIADELLATALRIVEGLVVDTAAIDRNLARFGLFVGTEPLLMALVRAGADRQAMHARIREHSMEAWTAVRAGRPNPLADRLAEEPALREHLMEEDIRRHLAFEGYVGDAPQRARAMAERLREPPEA